MYINNKYILPASLNALHAHFIVFVCVCVCLQFMLFCRNGVRSRTLTASVSSNLLVHKNR